MNIYNVFFIYYHIHKLKSFIQIGNDLFLINFSQLNNFYYRIIFLFIFYRSV